MWLSTLLLALTPQQDLDPAATLRAAAAALDAGRPTEALAELEAYAALAPADAEAQRLLGHVHIALEQPDLARRAFANAVQLGRPTPDTLAQLATLDAAAGRAQHALTALEWLAWLAPDDVNAALVRTQTQADLGHLEAARANAEQLTHIAPTSPQAWRLLASIELQRGAPHAAILALETAYWLAPAGLEGQELARMVADLHERAGSLRRALAWHERLGAPASAEERVRRAHLLFASGAFQATLTLLEPLTTNAAARELAGHAHFQLGQAAQADAAWLAAVRAGNRAPDVLAHLLAKALDANALDQLAELLPLFDPSSAPTERSTCQLLVRSYLRVNDSKSARASLVRYIAHAGFDATARQLTQELHAAH